MTTTRIIGAATFTFFLPKKLSEEKKNSGKQNNKGEYFLNIHNVKLSIAID
jgi:hypothetical protein